MIIDRYISFTRALVISSPDVRHCSMYICYRKHVR